MLCQCCYIQCEVMKKNWRDSYLDAEGASLLGKESPHAIRREEYKTILTQITLVI